MVVVGKFHWRHESEDSEARPTSSQSSVARAVVTTTPHFKRKDLYCIIIPSQGYMSLLDPKRNKTAVQLFDEMAKDRDLFIKVFCSNKSYAQTERLLNGVSLEDILELNKKFRLVVGGSTVWSCAFSDLIRFQCNCPLFWGRSS